MATIRRGHATECVVIVDDDPSARAVMADAVRRAGYAVVEAEDGISGFDALRRSRPKVAIVDVFLPNMSGLDLCERVRANPAIDDIFIILVTAVADSDELSEMARDVGADIALAKPFDPARLTEIVRAAFCGTSPANILDTP